MLLTLAAPVTLICLIHGHNGFLTALLLGGGLMLLDQRPFAAGLLFGCLIYKPQFALILPVLLLAGRHWRAIGGAMLSAALLVSLTLAIWGWPVWQAFLASLPLTRHVVIEQGSTGFHKIMSPFAAVRLWGGKHRPRLCGPARRHRRSDGRRGLVRMEQGAARTAQRVGLRGGRPVDALRARL